MKEKAHIIYRNVIRICTPFKHICTPFRKCPLIYKIATGICTPFKFLCITVFSFHHFNLILHDPKYKNLLHSGKKNVLIVFFVECLWLKNNTFCRKSNRFEKCFFLEETCYFSTIKNPGNKIVTIFYHKVTNSHGSHFSRIRTLSSLSIYI